jgi:hypothetical protein
LEGNHLIPIIRTGQVVSKVLKGKAKTPTLVLEGQNGEKWTLPLNDKVHLESFMIGQEIRVRFEDVPHYPLEPESKVEQPDPDDNQVIIEANATEHSQVSCPKGALSDEMGTAEVCIACEHVKRIGDVELGQGVDSCDLIVKSPEEPVQEKDS